MTAPRLIRMGRTVGEGIEALAPLVPIVFALLAVRALPWIIETAAGL